MSDPSNQQQTQFRKMSGKHYADGPPEAEFHRLIDQQVERVSITLQRRNQRGQFMSIPGTFSLTMDEMFSVADYIAQVGGGGTYRVVVRDPTDVKVQWFSFEVQIAGPPKLDAPVPAAAGAMPAMAGSANVYANMQGSDWFKNLRPEEVALLRQQALLAQQHGAPAAVFSSDAVLAEQVKSRDEELTKLREQREAEAAENKKRLEKIEKELADAREREREARAAGKIAALEAKLEAMASRPPETPRPGIVEQITAAAPLIAAAAPILQAFITSRASESQSALATQQQVLTAVLAQANAPRPDTTKELITTLAPMLTPLLAKAIEKPGADEQTALWQAMADTNLNYVSMMTQLIESSAPPPESAAGAVVKTVVEGLRSAAMAYATTRGGLAGQLAPVPQPVGVIPPPQPVAYDRGPQVVDEQPPAASEPQDAVPARRRRVVQTAPVPPGPKLQALFGLLPSAFQTPPWRTILERLHTDPPPPSEEMATTIAGHIESLIQLGQLPEQLRSVQEFPRQTLEALLEMLPVAGTRPDYVREVLDLTLAFLAQDNYITGPAEHYIAGADAAADAAEGEGEAEGEGDAAPDAEPAQTNA